MNERFGRFVTYADLSDRERVLVDNAMEAATHSHCYISNFAVGASLLAANATGQTEIFSGCNSENEAIGVGICAERNVASTALGQDYLHFKTIAVVASLVNPGGSPCGPCRQYMCQFADDGGIILIVADRGRNVRRGNIRDLLPAPQSAAERYEALVAGEKELVDQLTSHEFNAYVPYTNKVKKAALIARNADGVQRIFFGVETEIASFSGTIPAVPSAITAAVTAGYREVLSVAIQGTHRLDGFSLQSLREFGLHAKVLFISDEKSAVRSDVHELLPDSFGPEAL